MHDYKARFNELRQQGDSVPVLVGQGGFKYVESSAFAAWKASARNLLELTFGPTSSLTTRFIEIADEPKFPTSALPSARGHFRAAEEEYNRGFLRSVRQEISEEFVVDMCLRAEALLDEGHIQPAAVLTAAALEDAFRTRADEKNLYKEGNTLTDNINALKGIGDLSGATAKIVGGFPKFRNSALHADWKAITEIEIRTICSFLKNYAISL